MDEVLIVGGGVIGLSLALELSDHFQRVRVVDRGSPGRESSWAGAGILPPAVRHDRQKRDRPADHPLDQLAGLSHILHPQWASRLREESGIDTGYQRCGALYVARNAADGESLRQAAAGWKHQGIAVESVPPERLRELEPVLAGPVLPKTESGGPFAGTGEGGNSPVRLEPGQTAYLLPDEGQLRNPRHLKALIAACGARGVRIEGGVEAEAFDVHAGKIQGVRTTAGMLRAERFCLTGGAWSRGLLAKIGVSLAVKPVRGQMVLLECQRPLLRHIVNEGPRYLVPRADGRVLVGSTEEDAGFDKRTTAEGIAGLLALAIRLAPGLCEARVEQCWAGLRPATLDGLPYLGAVPGLDNAFVAAGHFRSGLQLSPGTAVVMGQLVRGETPEVDLSPFRIDRG